MLLRHLVIILSFLTTPLSLFAEENNNQTAYVSDQLTIFIHAGSSREYRIIGTIPSGEKLTVLETNSETKFTKIKSDVSKTGWVETEYLSTKPGVHTQVSTLMNELEQVQSQLNEKLIELERAQSTETAQQTQVAHLDSQLASIKNELLEKNDVIANFDQSQKTAEQKMMLEWFLKGGGILIGGVLLGYLLTLLPKRRRRENW